MGLVIAGFIPTPMGEVFEYTPSWVEVVVALGIWATGALAFTMLVKIALPLALDRLKHPSVAWSGPDRRHVGLEGKA